MSCGKAITSCIVLYMLCWGVYSLDTTNISSSPFVQEPIQTQKVPQQPTQLTSSVTSSPAHSIFPIKTEAPSTSARTNSSTTSLLPTHTPTPNTHPKSNVSLTTATPSFIVSPTANATQSSTSAISTTCCRITGEIYELHFNALGDPSLQAKTKLVNFGSFVSPQFLKSTPIPCEFQLPPPELVSTGDSISCDINSETSLTCHPNPPGASTGNCLNATSCRVLGNTFALTLLGENIMVQSGTLETQIINTVSAGLLCGLYPENVTRYSGDGYWIQRELGSSLDVEFLKLAF
ncbi:hypothetical protein GpartN1_g7631.t1 [Galdieria partita]|uniref:Uncharacterized protein n=1 Tax=Galdieria partita TaxID=83374 RepID=A0A9C7Q534_9RHOD|nr:hypothetical protein GpartN1_g7631.t1 [Galdieria partita]